MGPLQGVRVVEFAGIGPGPFAAMLLSDMGADVVRVARSAEAQPADALARGRTVVAADLKSDEGRDLVRSLAERGPAYPDGSPRVVSSSPHVPVKLPSPSGK